MKISGKIHKYFHLQRNHISENYRSESINISMEKMTHFPGENWSGAHLGNGPPPGFSQSEVPFPQLWNQEGSATYNELIGFQDLGE